MRKIRRTSWGNVKKWYSDSQSNFGDYFHRELIFPKLLPLLGLQSSSRVLDIGCGEGVFSRVIPPVAKYLGIDVAKGLIGVAQEKNKNTKADFLVQDATVPLSVQFYDQFTHATCILALQNIENIKAVFINAALALKKEGVFSMVINHPYFRIPKSTSWEIDYDRDTQYRRVDRYLSSHAVGIDMTPGREDFKKVTTSFHHPLSYYIQELNRAGFVLTGLHEWISPKTSQGKYAKMENYARQEIPLFMCLIAQKNQ